MIRTDSCRQRSVCCLVHDLDAVALPSQSYIKVADWMVNMHFFSRLSSSSPGIKAMIDLVEKHERAVAIPREVCALIIITYGLLKVVCQRTANEENKAA